MATSLSRNGPAITATHYFVANLPMPDCVIGAIVAPLAAGEGIAIFDETGLYALLGRVDTPGHLPTLPGFR